MPDRSHLRKDQILILERQDRKRAKKAARLAEPLETGEAQKAEEAAQVPVRTFKAIGVDQNEREYTLVVLEIALCADGQYRITKAEPSRPASRAAAFNRFKVVSQMEILK